MKSCLPHWGRMGGRNTPRVICCQDMVVAPWLSCDCTGGRGCQVPALAQLSEGRSLGRPTPTHLPQPMVTAAPMPLKLVACHGMYWLEFCIYLLG